MASDTSLQLTVITNKQERLTMRSSTGHQQARPNPDVVEMSVKPPPQLMTRASEANMDNTTSSQVRISPKFVSTTENEENKKLVKVYSWPLSVWIIVRLSTRAQRFSCVAALTALLLCTAFIIYYSVIVRRDVNVVDRAPHEWNITREMWQSRPQIGNFTVDEFSPLKLVVVQHTVSPECHRFEQCAAELRKLQRYFMDTEYLRHDLPYNFAIGNDGRVYEIRGWFREGAHTAGYNRCSLGVGFIGDYRHQNETGLIHSRVTELQLQRFNMLLAEGADRGFLRPDYSIVGARDVSARVTDSPGANLYRELQKMEHFERIHSYRNMTCEAIQEMLDGETT